MGLAEKKGEETVVSKDTRVENFSVYCKGLGIPIYIKSRVVIVHATISNVVEKFNIYIGNSIFRNDHDSKEHINQLLDFVNTALTMTLALRNIFNIYVAFQKELNGIFNHENLN